MCLPLTKVSLLLALIFTFLFPSNTSAVQLTGTATVTATPSPTRTVNEFIYNLIDDFENDASYANDPYHNDTRVYDGHGALVDVNLKQNAYGNDSYYVEFDMPPVAPGATPSTNQLVAFQVLQDDYNLRDYSGYDKITLDVTGVLTLKLNFRQWSNNTNSTMTAPVSVNAPDSWQTVSLDYSSINWRGNDPRHIDAIHIVITSHEGKFGFDNIRAGDEYIYGPWPTATITPTPGPTSTITMTPTPVIITQFNLIDNFDNDHRPHDAYYERDSAVWSDNPMQLHYRILSDGFKGNQTAYLQVYTYQNNNTVMFGDLHNQYNLSDFSNHQKLTMDVCGRVTLTAIFRKEGPSATGEVDTIEVNSPDAWQTIVFDYSQLDWKQVNPDRVREIKLTINKDMTDHFGLFAIDNIRLGDEPESEPWPTSTPTVTLTWTPIPTSVLVIDHFNNDNHYHDDPSSADAQWWTPFGGSFVFDEYAIGEDGSTAITIHLSEQEQWDYVVIGDLTNSDNHSDFSEKSTLTFDIAPHCGFSDEASMVIKFRDDQDRESGYLSSTGLVCSKWRQMSYDLTTVNWQQCDRTNVKGILLFIVPENLQTFGYVAIDNVLLSGSVPLPSAGVIDHFDNDCLLTDQPGYPDSALWSPDESVYNFDLAVDHDNSYLVLEYSKTSGYEWSYFCFGDLTNENNQSNFAGYEGLTMRMFSNTTTDLLIKFRDQNGNESAPAGLIQYNGTSTIQTMGLDIRNLYWQACDRTKVKEIMIFTAPGEIRDGQYMLDDIKLVQTIQSAGAVKWVDSSSVKAAAPKDTATMTSTISPTLTPTSTLTPLLTNAYLNKKKVVAFPNPACRTVTFAWKHEQVDKARIEIYSIAGDKIAVIEESQPGNQHLIWQAQYIAPGIYLYRTILTINGIDEVLGIRKLAIVK